MFFHFILACHSRRAATLACIRSAVAGAIAANVNYDFTLFDDGSRDGTSDAVLREFSKVRIIHGDGSNFWAKSMSKAESVVLENIAQEEISEQYIVWLNDDVVLDADAMQRLLKLAEVKGRNSILIGAMRDPSSGLTTYSGLKKLGLHPLQFRLVTPSDVPQEVEAFNGNLVLVPVQVAISMKGIDGNYAHGMADIDYGIRAHRIGVLNILAPGTFGTCSRNAPQAYRGVRREWRDFTGRKGAGHFKSLRKLLQCTSPRLWPIYLLLTYAVWICRNLVRTVVNSTKAST